MNYVVILFIIENLRGFLNASWRGLEFLNLSTDDWLNIFGALKNGGRPPLTYQSFVKLAGDPSWASSPLSITLSSLPPIGSFGRCELSEVPTVEELGYEETQQVWRSNFFNGTSLAPFFLRKYFCAGRTFSL